MSANAKLIYLPSPMFVDKETLLHRLCPLLPRNGSFLDRLACVAPAYVMNKPERGCRQLLYKQQRKCERQQGYSGELQIEVTKNHNK